VGISTLDKVHFPLRETYHIVTTDSPFPETQQRIQDAIEKLTHTINMV
tara:strand:+ start:906 stop:1049 length:144 start_codon:yes stop_codon:yes gene_type:complete